MAVTELSAVAKEGSSYFVAVSFEDEDGNAVYPDTVVWTLTDLDGNIINERQDVSIAAAATIEVVLSGDDLKCDDDVPNVGDWGVWRELLVEATYTTPARGTLPLAAAARFRVQPHVGY